MLPSHARALYQSGLTTPGLLIAAGEDAIGLALAKSLEEVKKGRQGQK